jgi:hydrophobe/amphiphile efflux-3 (HAE3) family protein
VSSNAFGRVVRFVARRPLPVLAITLVLALGGAALALRLEPSAATDTLVSSSSDTFQATERFEREFGGDAVVVLVKGELTRTVLTPDLLRVLGLEGCLAGNVPEKELAKAIRRNRRNPRRGLPPVCEELARLHPARAVYGPATFINTAASQIGDEFARRLGSATARAERAARAARRLSAARGDSEAQQRRLAETARRAVLANFQLRAARLALQYGLTDVPRINDPNFVSQLVFDGTRPGVPKSRFGYLFPSEDAALIQIRMRPGLSEAERRRAIRLVEEATRAPAFRPQEGARYLVTGVPVVTDALADAVQSSIFFLLAAAVLVMAATLALVFRTRLRLLPLALALAATGVTFGALSLAGGSLTMASIAVLPVLVGLAVDYAIQFQARYDEQRARRGGGERAVDDAVAAATAGGPTIVTAGVATAAGFLVLLLSPVPMVRGFGLLLVLGIFVALACALCAGFAALVRFGGRAEGRRRPPRFARVRSHPRLQAARERLADRSWQALGLALSRPRKVLAVGLAVAVVGLALDTQAEVVSDVQELVPQDLQALRDVTELQEATGVSGEIDVTVRADDVTRPEVLAWMTRFQAEALREHGYRPGRRCAQERNPPELCPALSLPDLFTSGIGNRKQVLGLLDSVPEYFSQGVIGRDRRTANLAFGIRLMPLDRQKEVVDDLKGRLAPPDGVEASVVGLPVLAAEANGALTSPWRRALTLLAALAAVFLVLFAVRRSARAAAVPLIPIALATGWSGGLLFVLGLLPGPLEVDLNPMSVTLSALVVAISTEFSVLLSSRYRQERENGAGAARAVELAYASTGGAVLASGVTAIAGFAVLMASDIRMLRDFGIVTVVDLTVSLLGVMLVLPAALVWAEEHGPFTLRDLDPRPWVRELRTLRTPADAP